ncbi:sugar phosphate nucleotidyltransferase [Nitrospira moscoviensis]|uniref:Putative Mannose-1-phosphate guanylyltransferase (GDP) n=1 Tax=Nitrospira moscoviensis TaxID=42253 RepID=A0A0K2GEL9_NITMO|nr:sugar phosphate nucleotidyltransferase [Nitrospira moscoviensis]ALA59398.1 putative Mannose-1-phosphate guanylyltransferase (GDP) [Nitrospira moscoviensis]
MLERSAAGRTVWSIVLAGGEGERVQPFVRRWLGLPRPKQYCAFVGTRSMFQHTVDRARRLVPGDRTVVVAARHHRPEVESQLRGRPIGKLLWQPANRDTAAGVFLPLSYVWRRNPEATVVVYPSDHFIWPEPRFLDTVRRAIASVEAMPDRMLLLGVQPDRLETEYGWIMRGAALGGSPAHPVRAVSAFVEKPSAAIADAAFRLGALWNTLVLVAKVETLWLAGYACVPDMMPLFERLASAWDGRDERATVEAVYREMPAYNFSAHLLQRAPTRVAVMELTGVLWSDWGKPERIVETIRRIGKTPAFPLSCLDRPFAPHAVPETALRIPTPV